MTSRQRDVVISEPSEARGLRPLSPGRRLTVLPGTSPGSIEDIPVIADTVVRLTLMALKRKNRENRRPLSPTD
ncbi:MAG: hypothetical protein ACLFRT_14370, partial [Actinomycetota bacterium]